MAIKAEIFEEVADMQHVEPAIGTDADEFEKVVRSRRSTRPFTDEPIPEGVIRDTSA